MPAAEGGCVTPAILIGRPVLAHHRSSLFLTSRRQERIICFSFIIIIIIIIFALFVVNITMHTIYYLIYYCLSKIALKKAGRTVESRRVTRFVDGRSSLPIG